MITGDRITPNMMLQPESAVQNRVLLLRRANVKPNTPESVNGLKIRSCNVTGIIPQSSAMQCRNIGDENCGKQGQPGDCSVKPPLVFERYFGYGWFSGSRSRTAGTLAHCTMIACTCEDGNLDWTVGEYGCSQITKEW